MHGPPGPLAARARAAPGCRTLAAPRPPTSRTFSRSRPREPSGRLAGGGRRSAAAGGAGRTRRGGGARRAGVLRGRGQRRGRGHEPASAPPPPAPRAREPDATAAQRRGRPHRPSAPYSPRAPPRGACAEPSTSCSLRRWVGGGDRELRD